MERIGICQDDLVMGEDAGAVFTRDGIHVGYKVGNVIIPVNNLKIILDN